MVKYFEEKDMQRYFILDNNIDLINKTIMITNNDVHHIKNVMRMKLDDNIICCDNKNSYLCKIITITNEYVKAEILDKISESNELDVDITIAHGLTTREKREEVIDKITELGAINYIPILCEKSVVRISDNIIKQTERLQKIAKEASEQSQRSRILNVCLPISIDELINKKNEFDLLFIASTRIDPNVNNLIKNIKPQSKILFLVGPEAGFSLLEEQKLLDAGFIPNATLSTVPLGGATTVAPDPAHYDFTFYNEESGEFVENMDIQVIDANLISL